ncbi:hypothetical protein K502DRAFT_366931 [Neoconidiobolus thromboides FSU 785]|nr:hypothetical protein K502DRAFT_366931 [Neoconidiobolus thromboides FSU 785]
MSTVNNHEVLDGSNKNVDIWSSILDSVALTKITPVKNVFLLGEPNSGKTTFLNFMKHESRVRDKPVTKGDQILNTYEDAPATTSEEDFFKYLDKNPASTKLAYTHSFVELKDEESDDTMARLNLYQLSEHDPKLHELVNLSLNYHTYKDSIALIFLDWSKPWEFINQLIKWLRVLEIAYYNALDHGGDPRTINDPNRWTQGIAHLDELKERLELFLSESKEQSKTPQPDNGEESNDTKTNNGSLIPEGCLTRNLGLPIFIVCTKSDKIKQVVRDAELSERHFDFIQHSLRAVGLMYGASLIYTSTLRPDSFSLLRNYLLYRLFSVTISNTNQSTDPSNTQAPSTSILPSYLNHFKVKGRFMERERIFIPSGWDSYNKIRILDSNFDCEAVQEGTAIDLYNELSSHLPAHHLAKVKKEEDEEEIMSFNEAFSSMIPLPFSSKNKDLETSYIIPEPEQQFLAAHYAMFQGLDSSNFFKSQMPYVGTVGMVGKGEHTNTTESKVDTGTTESAASGNSFFKMLAMKDSSNN